VKSKSDRTESKQREIEEIVRCLRLVGRVHARHSRELMRDFKITGTQLGVIRTLERCGSMSVGELSRRIYLHISTVSSIVDRLEAAGHLRRTRGAGDRRVVLVELTAAGRGIARRAPVYAFGFLVRDIEGLAPAEINKIRDALRVLLKVMRIKSTDLGAVNGAAEVEMEQLSGSRS
jgi:MarR family transcriptional regulator, organic hydroperoxide resistance regulator